MNKKRLNKLEYTAKILEGDLSCKIIPDAYNGKMYKNNNWWNGTCQYNIWE